MTSSPAAAFCGFYVAGSGEKLVSEASRVALMRHGNRTVITMQNAYKGPAEDFALVVPVPVVLKKENVKTLEPAIFDRLDQLTAPRLVEYWEQDPCATDEDRAFSNRQRVWSGNGAANFGMVGQLGVTVEARFVVGEYKIKVLAASDSTGLEAWLGEHGYKVPDGAAAKLRPYVDEGMKFFVAKVDPSKVQFSEGRALLSPLRFDFEQAAFRLPIRLGTINSDVEQDLLIYVIAPEQRYQAANRQNRFLATNLTVKDAARSDFGGLYQALFEQQIKGAGPDVVVTEYAWRAQGCDPCPTQPLTSDELRLLGRDQFPWGPEAEKSMVVTRLHTRIGVANTQDLVFEKATPVKGGQEGDTIGKDRASPDVTDASINRFQSRSVIRHQWPGEVACKRPRFRIWGQQPPPEKREAAQSKEGQMGVKPRPIRSVPPKRPIAATRSIDDLQKSPPKLRDLVSWETGSPAVEIAVQPKGSVRWWRWAPMVLLAGAVLAARRR